MKKYAIGLDFGTNSCRSLIVDLADGRELTSHVSDYPSGQDGIWLDPQDPNVARVVVPAGVHAAGHLQLDVPEIVKLVQIPEPCIDRGGHGDGPGIGQRAVVQTWAGDHVGQGADICRRQSISFQRPPELEQIALEVLLDRVRIDYMLEVFNSFFANL